MIISYKEFGVEKKINVRVEVRKKKTSTAGKFLFAFGVNVFIKSHGSNEVTKWVVEFPFRPSRCPLHDTTLESAFLEMGDWCEWGGAVSRFVVFVISLLSYDSDAVWTSIKSAQNTLEAVHREVLGLCMCTCMKVG